MNGRCREWDCAEQSGSSKTVREKDELPPVSSTCVYAEFQKLLITGERARFKYTVRVKIHLK